jgi:hypothetical protein
MRLQKVLASKGEENCLFFQHGGKEAAEEQEHSELKMDLNDPFPIPPVTPFLRVEGFG